ARVLVVICRLRFLPRLPRVVGGHALRAREWAGLRARTAPIKGGAIAPPAHAKWFASLLAIEFVQDQDFRPAIEMRSDPAAHFLHVGSLAVRIKRSLIGISLIEIEDRRILH